jgi:hypothetical protein
MAETKINISDLKQEGSDFVKELTAFLEEKTSAKVESGTAEITIKPGDKENAVSRTYLRVLLRKFLHRNKLREYYRVIGGKDNALVVKKIKIADEEEEE